MAAEISYRGRTSPAHALAVAERLADEYNQEARYRNLEDGTIEVPEVLRPYLGGQEVIGVQPPLGPAPARLSK